MDRGFLLDDPPLTGLGGRPGMAFDEVDLLHEHPILLVKYLQDFPRLALLFAGNDLDQVVLPDVKT